MCGHVIVGFPSKLGKGWEQLLALSFLCFCSFFLCLGGWCGWVGGWGAGCCFLCSVKAPDKASAMNVLAQLMMKGAARCGRQCEMQNSVNY